MKPIEIIKDNNKLSEMITQKSFDNFSQQEKEKLYKVLQSPEVNNSIQNKIKKLLYLKEPPTPEEFLDYHTGWITKGTSESLREWVQIAFVDIINNSHKYNIISFYGATRLGKSVLTRLLIYYTHIYINHLRDPHAFFEVSPDTNLAQYLICFNYNKTKQLLTKPIFDLMNKSERVVLVKQQSQVKSKQAELGPDSYVYSKAAETGALTNAKNFQVQLGNASPLSLIGSDIIQTYVTEIAFFIESEGASEDEIYRLYSDSVSRIRATMGIGKALAWTLLDSSANIAESKIEKHILQDLAQQDDVYFIRMSQWDVKELAYKSFPVWWKDRSHIFKVCTGNGNYPAKIIENEQELEDIPSNLIVDVPKDAENEFRGNLVKSIKDIAGFPASSENQLFQDITLIRDMFVDYMPNIEGLIIADSKDQPEKLIWEQVHQKFFTQVGINKLNIKRANNAMRYIHIDHAFSSKGDVAGIACIHLERDFENKETKFVVDFAFPIGPGINEINLAAIEHFILDLHSEGLLPIAKVTSDTFQSKTFEQNLKRRGINAEVVSVDRTLDPYLSLVTQLFNHNIVCGKNIFLKNNLNNLVRTRTKTGKEKIDHPIGETNNKYYGDWEKSSCGTNAKDVSDALSGAVYSAIISGELPMVDFNKENLKFEDVNSEILVDDAVKMLRKWL